MALKNQLEIMKRSICIIQRDGNFNNANNLEPSITFEVSTLLKTMHFKNKTGHSRHENVNSKHDSNRENARNEVRDSKINESNTDSGYKFGKSRLTQINVTPIPITPAGLIARNT